MEISVVSTQASGLTALSATASALSRIRTSSSTAGDNIPRSLVYLAQSVQWDPGDRSVRRFSDPAVDSTRARLLAQISSARTAYAKALISITQSSRSVDVTSLLQNSTEEDVAQLARNLDASSAAEGQGAVSRLVNVLHHYHDVFDVLSQADFSYLPLIWGGMKLILVFAKNRTDLLEKLADMLVEVGMSLSRIEIYSKLYPTERMLSLTSDLYAAVIDFLQEVITTFQRSAVRKLFSSMVRPFDEKYGRLVARIKRLENDIQRDGFLLQALQTASIAHHHVDSFLQRYHLQDALNSIPQGSAPDVLSQIKNTLFTGFEHQASYHESLVATYSVTAGPAWEKWFRKEQKYLPSVMAAENGTRLVQGLCDAPDFQHALQWAEQQQVESPSIPWAFLIWARGMTAHSAIASLIFQFLQQRPAVVAGQNLDMRTFQRASTSIKALWDIFLFLMRALGGCAIYISIGSVGPEEFAVVAKFVKTVREWDGLPIRVTIIHPYHEGFVLADDATEIDGAYDVPPSLTTTDALQHVLMLELGVREVSDTIRTVLWESLWRETRYAVIGVALIQLLQELQTAAEDSSRGLDQAKRKLWLAGVSAWIDDDVSTNNVREMIQRHIDIVPLEPSDDMRAHLAQQVKLAVFSADTDSQPVEALGNRSLTPPQREHVWDRMQEAIRPGTKIMFSGSLEESVEEVLDRLSETEIPLGDARQSGKVIRRVLNAEFSREGGWKASIADDKELIIKGIADAISKGFVDVIKALIAPQNQGGQALEDVVAFLDGV